MRKIPSFVKIIAVCFAVLFVSINCEKKEDFPKDYSGIYGEWTIRYISGGFTGGSIAPKFDILSIYPGMTFRLYRNDTLVSKGTIEITGESYGRLEADFKSEKDLMGTTGTKMVELHNDTLILSDKCSDCYSSIFVRSVVYSDENYLQASRTLDFVDVTSYPVGFAKNFTSIYFQSESLGFITCYDGSILKSSNGGRSWKQILTGTSLPLYDISFINDQVGFAVGGQSNCGGTGCIPPGYLMLKTTDGGETWDSIPLPYKMADLRKIKFHSYFGIAAGAGARLLTRDGGQTWTSITDDNMNVIFDIYIIDETRAFVSATQGRIFRTTDAGASWQKLGNNSEYPVQSMMFLSEQSGYASSWNTLQKTTDGGMTWRLMDYAPVSASLINFFSENNGVVFGSRTYATSKWDVWDSYFNVMINGKWYGDARVTSHNQPYCLNANIYYTLTWDNRVQIIRLML